jgi:dihydroflavonol-4-reductase
MTNNNNTTVCVTGATGFIASHLVKQLLEKGYTVHGTVRSLKDKNKYEFLFRLPNANSNTLKIFEADLMKDGSFDEAVAGCSIVYHTASPILTHQAIDPQKEYVEPAVRGTLTVLESAGKTNSVKRVIITSSGAAVYDTFNFEDIAASHIKPFDEFSWNNTSSVTTEPYRHSKAVAEKAAWKYMEQNKGELSIELSAINPLGVFGPVLQDYKANSSINASTDYLLNVIKNLKDQKPISVFGFGIVDVRDVAAVHILVGESTEAANNRFIASNGVYSSLDLARLLQSELPDELGLFKAIADGDEEAGRKKSGMIISANVPRYFPSFRFTETKQTLVDAYNDYKKHKLI